MIKINNIKLSLSSKVRFDGKNWLIEKELKNEIIKKLRITTDRFISFKICKQSIDARKKEDVKLVLAVDVEIKDEAALLKKNRDKDIFVVSNIKEEDKSFKSKNNITINECNRKIIIVGAGPAGLFCALKLAEAGLKPILLERGEDVDKRIK